MYYTKTVCLSYPLPVSPSVATIYLLGSGSFSRCSLVYQNLPCHIGLISASPPLTHPVLPSTFHILLLCEPGPRGGGGDYVYIGFSMPSPKPTYCNVQRINCMPSLKTLYTLGSYGVLEYHR